MLAKTKLETIEVLKSKAVINSYVNDVKFGSVNIVLKEYDNLEEEIKNAKNAVIMVMYCVSCKGNNAK